MRLKHLLFTFTAISCLFSCKSSNNRFSIIGNLSGMPEQTVVLEQLNANDIITIVDSERSSADGHFEVSGVAQEQALYRLHFHPNRFILLSIDKGNVKVTGDWNAIEGYSVAGSPSSEDLKNFLAAIKRHLRDYNSMSIVLDTLQAKGNDSMTNIAKKDFQDMRLQFTQFVERYADTVSYEPNAVFAARILNPATEAHYLDAFSQSLGRRFPGTKMTKEFREYFAGVVRQRTPAGPAASIDDGSMAPDINLPSTDGKTVALSSLKGKYVLLDFWASWCGPCRGENPNVVEAYQRFKDKNFTVYSVSLDNNKDAWEKAITDDNLMWTHVSDLKGWQSTAAHAYAVQSIPTNFLIDPKGKIIAHNLRGNRLQEMLQELLKTPNP